MVRLRTLGIDLAAQAKETAACLISWGDGGGSVEEVATRCADPQLLDLPARTDKVGIDAPLGWPDEFVAAVAGHHGREHPSGFAGADDDAFRARLSYRETDRRVMPVRRPLSVSTDRIAVPAMRCAGLLDRIGGVDRAGLGKVLEVYPAAALTRWGIPFGRYKNEHAAGALPEMVAALRRGLPRLELGERVNVLSRDDDAFDALVAALVARAAGLGLTDEPDDAVLPQARREGWIHLPEPGSLARL